MDRSGTHPQINPLSPSEMLRARVALRETIEAASKQPGMLSPQSAAALQRVHEVLGMELGELLSRTRVEGS
jgi:hypothetical protein